MEIMPILQWVGHHSVVVMLALFLVIVGLTYRPREKRQIEKHGQIPLEDDR